MSLKQMYENLILFATVLRTRRESNAFQKSKSTHRNKKSGDQQRFVRP